MMPLSEDDKERLFRHWKTIKSNVEMRYIVDILIEERVISPDEWEDMKKSHPLEKDRTEAFLHWLLKQSDKCYDSFLKALQNGKYDFVSDKLDRNSQTNNPLADPPTQLGGGRHDWDNGTQMNPRNFKLLVEKVNNSDTKIDALKKENEEFKSILLKKQDKLETLLEKYKQKEEEYSNLRQTFHRQNTDIKKTEEEMKNLESKLKKAEQEVERLRREKSQKEEELIKLGQTCQKAEWEIQRLARENTQKEDDLNNLTLTSRRQTTELITVREQMGNVESKLNTAKQEIERLQRDNTQLNRQSFRQIQDEIKTKNEGSKSCSLQ